VLPPCIAQIEPPGAAPVSVHADSGLGAIRGSSAFSWRLIFFMVPPGARLSARFVRDAESFIPPIATLTRRTATSPPAAISRDEPRPRSVGAMGAILQSNVCIATSYSLKR
jgi:hypothetical protein